MKKLIIFIHQSCLMHKDISLSEIKESLKKDFKILNLKVLGCDAQSFEIILKNLADSVSEINSEESNYKRTKLLIITSELIYGEFPFNSLEPNNLAKKYKNNFPNANIIWGIFDHEPLFSDINYNVINFYIERKYPDINERLINGIKSYVV